MIVYSMENKRQRRWERRIVIEDKITLSLEELESIAGGDILQDRMNAEENAHYNKLHKRFVDVGVDYLNGDASKAEYDAAKDELWNYVVEMQKKYNYWLISAGIRIAELQEINDTNSYMHGSVRWLGQFFSTPHTSFEMCGSFFENILNLVSSEYPLRQA